MGNSIAKVFLLFAFDPAAPKGGWNDFKGNFHSQTDATTAAELLDKSLLAQVVVIDVVSGVVP